jgi:hypothetical protein
MTSSMINAVLANFNVNKLAVTGLSLGAQDFTNYAYSDSNNFKKIAALFLFSPLGTTKPLYGGWQVPGKWFATYHTYLYEGCATQDPLGFYPDAIAEYDTVVAYKVTPAPEFTNMTCNCHGAGSWGPFYSKYWMDPVTGRNIYDQFMYLFPVPKSIAALPPVVVPPVVIVPPVVSCPPPIKQRTAVGFTLTYVNGVTTAIVNYSDSTSGAITP